MTQLEPHMGIRSRLISGTFKRLDGTTVLTPEGKGTRVDNHGQSIPDAWIPPGIGPLIVESETRKQFEQMRNEVLRRKAIKSKLTESTQR